MKIHNLFLLFIFFLTCFSSAMTMEKEKYSVMETVIGEMPNIVNKITADDITIYEGKRDVEFERGLVEINQTYYFYFIPTRVGEFNIIINNLKYNSSGNIIIQNVNKTINVSDTINSTAISINPGAYKGDDPEIVITNLRNEYVNVSMNKTNILMAPLETKRVKINARHGFSMFPIDGYNVPIMNFGGNESVENESVADDEEDYVDSCLNISLDDVYVASMGEVVDYFFIVNSYCFDDIHNISINYSSQIINVPEINFDLNRGEDKIIRFDLYSEAVGYFFENISLYVDGKKINEEEMRIRIFENESDVENFVNSYDTNLNLDCSAEGGEICQGGCSDDSGKLVVDGWCCFNGCIKDLNEKKSTNMTSILIAILGIIVIAIVVFLLWKRSKNFKSKKPEERFGEVEKQYERKFMKNEAPQKNNFPTKPIERTKK